MTLLFVTGLAALLLLGPVEAPHPVAIVVLLAYAVAARADFPIGSGHVVPTQVFLVPLFVLAPAAMVPGLVFVGLAVGLLGDVARGRTRLDRLAYCGGDSIHALGPALVITLFAGGHGAEAAPEVLVLAFVAQLAFDFASSSLHDRLVFGTRPEIHVRVLLQVWGVDAALAPIGVAAADLALRNPWFALAALPLVGLLAAMAADRSRRISSAHGRLEALRHERRRREAAVLRVGERSPPTSTSTRCSSWSGVPPRRRSTPTTAAPAPPARPARPPGPARQRWAWPSRSRSRRPAASRTCRRAATTRSPA